MGNETVRDINSTLSARKELDAGISVLNTDEWRKLQAFADMAVNKNPATEEAMRTTLALQSGDELKQDFKDTVGIYASLKADCAVFKDEIQPKTVELASDIVQYQRRVDTVYERLIRLLEEHEPGRDIAAKLVELAKQWGTGAPSVESAEIKVKFQKYVERLLKDAEERAKRALELNEKMKVFKAALERSSGEFEAHVTRYRQRYGGAEKEVERIKGEIALLDQDLTGARKKDKDERIVLATAPVYLVIPVFGPFIMAGVLIGVGIDLGLQVERIKEKVKKLEAVRSKLGIEQKFFAEYKTGMDLTQKTKEDLTIVQPLVAKIAAAWNALTSDLKDLRQELLKDAEDNALAEEWDLASLDLETARKTWRALEQQADRYRNFAVAKSVETAEELSSGVKVAA
ncbi:hypothetical protein [Nonomuraea sp. B19D2]|uniref:hypothetical protein n=1 Tax=Nonomuraea sp. B19D2 TaxID=3159561 RepID=UPI0032DBE368